MFAYYVLYMYLTYIGRFVIGIVEVLVIDFLCEVVNGIENNGETEFAIHALRSLFGQPGKLYSLNLFLQVPVIHEFLPPLGNDLSFKLLRELRHFVLLKCMKGEE
jgi:hypothetical protein